MYLKEHPDFFAATCLAWKHLLEDDKVEVSNASCLLVKGRMISEIRLSFS